MVNIIRPIAGQVSSWTSCGFTATDFNSLANGAVAIMPSGAAIDNTINLDDYIDVSFAVTVGATTTTASFLSLYLLPLNQDGTTYGDTTPTGATTAPAPSYWLSNAFVRSGLTSGSIVPGMFPMVPLSVTKFVLGIANNLGGALNATASWTGKYRTWNFTGNG